MAQSQTGVSEKSNTSPNNTLTHAEFNSVNNTINSNSTDAETRLSSIETNNTNQDSRLNSIESSSISIQSYTNENLPSSVSDNLLSHSAYLNQLLFMLNLMIGIK